MHKRILVLGASGMLGGSLFRHFSSSKNYDVLGTTRSENAVHLVKQQGFENIISNINVDNLSSIEDVIRDFKPDFLFNCIGIIKQLDAAKNNICSIEINSLFPHKLAKICTKYGAKLIHFSTDCVFSGEKGNYFESNIPDSTDLYGRTKHLGEVTYSGHLTLRTSIIGHELASHHSLIDWFLSQSIEVKGFSKAIFSGLPTCYMAEIIDNYVLPCSSLSGLKHLSVSPINKYELLNLVNSIYGKNIHIHESQDLVIDRSLNSDLFKKETGFQADSWNNLIKKMHNEYNKYFQ
ncbi:dTDP-4-dehydrorhamnose reductase family protein [Xenorhabdus miraniensis]|uniref:dTDP-4-dehydrorhamnose reductase n=1 Tax=Xenorhabdus miraniensis TaxID=351674 RepID=A0A2D0JLT4_9GAMM|nr:SDR family oxidoreductase [Xenorhabdus miraniensis]PHM47213.1 dTDP-6-deoxy-L-mannose dehydrogenase RmlD [Xenorhabdus miraniensis]